MKFLVIGCGSIGKRHIRNLKSILQNSDDEVFAYDAHAEAMAFVRKEYQVRTFDNLDAALMEASAAFICVPNHLHVPLALKAVQHNCHVFIEKPLSHSRENVEELLSLAREKSLTVTCGYMLRFYSPLKKVKDLLDNQALGKIYGARIECGYYLPYWRPTQDYRQNYGARKNEGGGIILDAIHELNYLQWLLGKAAEVFCYAGKKSNLEINTEDYAELLIKFENGITATAHLDYLQRSYRRNLEIIGEKGMILWDFNDHSVTLYDDEKKRWEISKEDKMDFNVTYLDEEKHFVDCVRKKSPHLISGEEAYYDLKLALAALESAEKGVVVRVE